MTIFDVFNAMAPVLDMFDNYASRAIANFEVGELFIDTARVTDGRQPYETAISCPLYKGLENDKMCIVEAYDTPEQAQVGHDKWVETMTKNPPAELVDCQNSAISQLMDATKLHFARKPRKATP